jgi:hypothetical protein
MVGCSLSMHACGPVETTLQRLRQLERGRVAPDPPLCLHCTLHLLQDPSINSARRTAVPLHVLCHTTARDADWVRLECGLVVCAACAVRAAACIPLQVTVWLAMMWRHLDVCCATRWAAL